jgi:hypothetical protein
LKFSSAVSTAAYCVIEDIEHYNKIGGSKKEISRLAVQIYTMNEMCAPRNKSITSLLNRKKIIKFIDTDETKKHKNVGYTAEQIHKLLDICEGEEFLW